MSFESLARLAINVPFGEYVQFTCHAERIPAWHDLRLLVKSRRKMRPERILMLVIVGLALAFHLQAQEQPAWEIRTLSGEGGVFYNLETQVAIATNGVMVRYGTAVLTADKVIVDQNSGEVMAEGRVRIQRDDQVWVSDEVRYNFKTRRFEAQQFRTGKSPFFAAGEGLQAEPRQRGLLKPFQGQEAEPGGPTIIGASTDHIVEKDKELAARAVRRAAMQPAYIGSLEAAKAAESADLNDDGFVTTDELLALKAAGLSAEELLRKLEATGQIFELSREQQALLWSNGLDRTMVEQIPVLNPSERAGVESPREASRQEQMRSQYVYSGTNAIITADDIANPFLKVRAKSIRIDPGRRLEAHDAVLYVGDVPVFYFPFYSRNLDRYANHFTFMPGYRSIFGPFLLSTYNWYLNDELSGGLHFDYRIKRGFGGGPDVDYNFGKWGMGQFRYYYMYDQDPHQDTRTENDPNNRQRVFLSYLANPATNLSLRSMVRFQGDTNIIREFFESEYRRNPQPSTFVEANKYWSNFSLDMYAQPRVNDFLETVERLPDVRLTGFRQQLGETPLYYESESSAGYYRRLFAETNSMPTGLDYSAGRVDTYHQVLWPETFLGLLRFTPRIGARYTYYTEASGPGATTEEQSREVLNTGAEISTKASRTWPGFHSATFDMDGARHILEPSFNYVFVPRPTAPPRELPQFDRELPSFRLLPIEYPDYNAIDAVDSQNVLRLGLRNRLQTKRRETVVDVGYWDLYTDWRLDPRSDQTRFADLYSDLVLRPRSWLTFESITRYNVEEGQWRMSYHTLSIEPNDTWSLGLGHFYLRDDFSGAPTALGEGSDQFISTVFYRMNENWGVRASHRFDVGTGRMQEQAYTVYRDLRSWTAALTLRLRDNPQGQEDFTFAFTFSLKAFPRYGMGADALREYTLWGY